MPTKQLNDWAKNHSGLISLGALVVAVIGVFVAVISVFGPWLLEKLSSFITFASTLLIIVRQYSQMGVWTGFALIIAGLFLRMRTHSWRLSSLEKDSVEFAAGIKEMRTLSLRLSNLEKQTVVLLDNSESADLANWDYTGDWRSDEGVLSVTNSDDGGLSKSGTAWENYDLIFRFKLVKDCAGWIVRAQGFSRYVMIQCTKTKLRPHTRDRTFPLLLAGQTDPERGFKLVKEIPHGLSLREWNTVKTEVRGYGIRVSINERTVFSDSELLRDLPLGRVGFRCSGAEHALFRDIEVVQKGGCSIY
jgi:hypothetical protein